MLGYDIQGTGPTTVVVLNDWICDTSTWDNARAYLDTERLRWVFADVRGYGRSKGLAGSYTLLEAVGDVLALADRLSCEQFVIVGHSMSSLVALHLAQHHQRRIRKLVLLTPAPPAGFAYDDAARAAIQALALGDDAHRLEWLRRRLGSHVSEGWVRFKAARWRAASDSKAVAGYTEMFPKGVPKPDAPVTVPVLAVTGERDVPPMRSDAVREQLSPICRDLCAKPLMESGHYPMQETPPALVALIEEFLLRPSEVA